MAIEIKVSGEPKEIATLVLELQGRQSEDFVIDPRVVFQTARARDENAASADETSPEPTTWSGTQRFASTPRSIMTLSQGLNAPLLAASRPQTSNRTRGRQEVNNVNWKRIFFMALGLMTGIALAKIVSALVRVLLG